MKVAIATESHEKIKGIKKAFSRFFCVKETELEVYFRTTDSGVSLQPFNDETYVGARNRVDNIKESNGECDFYVGCDAGIECFAGICFNVQVICIFETVTQKYLFGKSFGWQIPTKDFEIIKEKNLDTYLRGKGIQSIEELLGSSYSRNEAVAQATEVALASRKL